MAMVDTVYWLPIQAGLRLKLVGLVQRSAATWCHFCIHRVNRVNSRDGSQLVPTVAAPFQHLYGCNNNGHKYDVWPVVSDCSV